MIKYRMWLARNLFFKLDDFEVDVDNPIDFEFAEFLYLKYKHNPKINYKNFISDKLRKQK